MGNSQQQPSGKEKYNEAEDKEEEGNDAKGKRTNEMSIFTAINASNIVHDEVWEIFFMRDCVCVSLISYLSIFDKLCHVPRVCGYGHLSAKVLDSVIWIDQI